jgi:hypothetical protein
MGLHMVKSDSEKLLLRQFIQVLTLYAYCPCCSPELPLTVEVLKKYVCKRTL